MIIPTKELIKETFAEFGLTYYHSEALCKGLGIFYALMSFKDVHDATRPRLEEKLVEASSLTLGIVIDKVKPLVSQDLQSRLDEALDKRNYLAHQFWYEHAYDMQSEAGLNVMIVELHQSRELFDELDSKVMELTTQRLHDIGITAEILGEQMQKGLAGEPEPPLPAKSPLNRKMVRIVAAYDVELEQGVSALVFVTDDKQFLQLCDVGLGWSNFTQVESNWTINIILQEYLPASVVPRPQITDSWNYEFTLPKKSVLWVKRGRADKTFRWGVRTPQKPD